MTFHDHRTPRPAAVPPAARGLPGPMRRAQLREALADRVERYLAILDALDGDPDLEDDELDHDAGDDREEENEHGGDIQDEPHDREPDDEDSADREPSLCGLTVSWPSAGGDDREEVNEDGTDPSYARKAPRPKREPQEYILNVRGDCCHPVHPHGSQVLCSTAAPASGDFVAIHFKPATAKRLGFDAWLKRLVFMNAPGGRGNIEPCVCVEQLNPPKSYVIPRSEIDAVHRVTGPKPATVRGVQMTAAERAQFHQTWIRNVSVEVVK